MGRYAFFNTGVEYKFTFAVQFSSDMLEFGGTSEPCEGYEYVQSWEQKEAPSILDQLRGFEDVLGLPELDFEKFSKDSDGTSKMRYTLWEYLDLEQKEHCRYQLGCVIYHQLLYQPSLRVTFEG